MNSLVEMKSKDGKMTFLRMDVYSLVIHSLFAFSFRGGPIQAINLDNVKVYLDGKEQLPPPMPEQDFGVLL